MATPQQNPLPPSFVLAGGMQITFAAIDETTGAAVAGVQVGSVSISVDQFDSNGGASGPDPMPLLVPADL